jgi:hypothetical protein
MFVSEYIGEHGIVKPLVSQPLSVKKFTSNLISAEFIKALIRGLFNAFTVKLSI